MKYYNFIKKTVRISKTQLSGFYYPLTFRSDLFLRLPSMSNKRISKMPSTISIAKSKLIFKSFNKMFNKIKPACKAIITIVLRK